MSQMQVFVSVGTTANDRQEAFVRAVEDRLRAEGLSPCTVGRNSFSSDSPFKAVIELMGKCSGIVVIALERIFVEAGAEKRGGAAEKQLAAEKIATPWNQIEGALAYARGYPLLVLVEEGVRADGLFETSLFWHVQTVKLDATSLNTPMFNGVLASWKAKLMLPAQSKPSEIANPSEMTVSQLLGSLKAAQLWSLLLALAAVIAGAFAIGAKLIGS
jgi:hypothetical protein